MTSRNRRITAARDVKRRAKLPPPEIAERCAAFGCASLTQRSKGKGFSEVYCAQHIERIRRHGHPTRSSYRAWELKPYRQAAKAWLRLHQEDFYVRSAIAQLDSLMAVQGRSKDFYHQRSMLPKDKARNILARLHEAGKTGEKLLEIVLTIKAAHAELGPWGYPDWLHVQIAKQAKGLRGVSGTQYPCMVKKYAYRSPRGAGLYMRLLGAMIEERARDAADSEAVEEVRALAGTRRSH
ncbi:hypothetical protein [Manganibacter manganicus]|uniref:Uncharacterized protein n=1 Tax=Manganibacter manganicus TaxID=1873176 RepID=A0A1V8RQH7_9HYPH|nr:hypothetical protein [Pseudaminobacter manganicus]OQM75239.1 hypothetical protein BFN67_18940 [Pseudaminobacter manganicus]